MFTNERTKELDRQIKAAGITPPRPSRKGREKKKNTCFRNFLAGLIWYERFMRNPKNAEIIIRMRFYNNNFNL